MSTELEKTGENKIPERDELGRLLPGNTSNPNGRPKGTFSLVSMLKNELQKCPEGEDKKTYAELLVKRIMQKAIKDGDDQQIKNILQYVEGMPKQRLEIEGEIKTALVEFVDGKITIDDGKDKDTSSN